VRGLLRLPDRWAACATLADGFIVPSEHSRQIFSERMACPVLTVPFGTDTSLYEYYDRPEWPTFIFLMSGLLHYRKGVEFALRALREEFEANEPVQLWLKTRRGFLDAGDEWRTLDDPRVHVTDEDYTRAQMVNLYHSVDCLLAPSRGEGSGLTPRDAMATGLPVILTNWSGLAELADERYGYPVPIDALEPAPLDCSSYENGVTGGGPIGNFARPSIQVLREQMRAAYEDRAGAMRRGKAAAEWMRQEWTWGICAGRWLNALEELTMKYVSV
jgi:glycosyltransferase involved in cell wall biosynthesis